MTVKVHPHFKKSYKKRILFKKDLVKKVQERLELFKKDSTTPILKDHSLTGEMKGYRAFSVTGDIRIVYFLEDDAAWLYDIGTHNQVYR